MTIASTTMDGMVEREAPASTRGLGIVAIATGIAGLVLLAGHPGGDAKIFADVIRNEAANQGMKALVHGGFIVVLAFQVICSALFSRSLGHRVSALAGFVFF